MTRVQAGSFLRMFLGRNRKAKGFYAHSLCRESPRCEEMIDPQYCLHRENGEVLAVVEAQRPTCSVKALVETADTSTGSVRRPYERSDTSLPQCGRTLQLP